MQCMHALYSQTKTKTKTDTMKKTKTKTKTGYGGKGHALHCQTEGLYIQLILAFGRTRPIDEIINTTQENYICYTSKYNLNYIY